MTSGAKASQLESTILGFTTSAHIHCQALTSALQQTRAADRESDLVVFHETKWTYLHADEFALFAQLKSKKFVDPLTLIECLRRKPDMINTLGSCGTLWLDESQNVFYYLLFASINRGKQSMALADKWSDGGGGGLLTRWLWTPFTSI